MSVIVTFHDGLFQNFHSSSTDLKTPEEPTKYFGALITQKEAVIKKRLPLLPILASPYVEGYLMLDTDSSSVQDGCAFLHEKLDVATERIGYRS